MILAAGFGRRMRPLTDTTPKPLLTVGGKALIDFHLEKLARAGFTQVLINLAYKGAMIEAHCGQGERYGLQLSYSHEGEQPLETGGAILAQLPWFKQQPFALVSADVYTDFDFALLARQLLEFERGDDLAHLLLVNNPAHHQGGDFCLTADRVSRPASNDAVSRYTFAGIGLLKPALIADFPGRQTTFALREALFYAIAHGRISGSHFAGSWSDVGTPARLAALQP